MSDSIWRGVFGSQVTALTSATVDYVCGKPPVTIKISEDLSHILRTKNPRRCFDLTSWTHAIPVDDDSVGVPFERLFEEPDDEVPPPLPPRDYESKGSEEPEPFARPVLPPPWPVPTIKAAFPAMY